MAVIIKRLGHEKICFTDLPAAVCGSMQQK